MIRQTPERSLDLGSSGGVPGLVLALLFPGSFWVLLDSAARRT
ncbi:MAG: RsmG family class I SAM-dependent methyltransferase, partial [Actinomycetota bacterium]